MDRDWTLRPGRAEDIGRLRGIEAAGLATYAGLPGFGFLEGGAVRDPQELMRGIGEGTLVVAEGGGTAQGFAMAWVVDGRAHLAELAVVPGWQRRGIATALVAAVLGWARDAGHGAITLTCYVEVPWNAPWYARLGWRGIAVGPDRPGLAAVMAEEAAAGYARRPRLAMERAVALSPGPARPR